MSFTRVRAIAIVALLVLAAMVVVVVAVFRDSQANEAGLGCPPGATRVNRVLPDDAAQVTLRVFNGTTVSGRAESVTTEFKNRGFRVQPPGRRRGGGGSASDHGKVAGVAVIQYGPRTVGAAQWINAYFLGEAKLQYTATRNNDVIGVVIGAKYRQLATRTEVNQAIAQLGSPPLPPGACDGPAASGS